MDIQSLYYSDRPKLIKFLEQFTSSARKDVGEEADLLTIIIFNGGMLL